MTLPFRILLPLLLSFAVTDIQFAQTDNTHSTALDEKTAPSAAMKQPFFSSVRSLALETLLPSPPVDGSPTAVAELKEVHRMEQGRTPEEMRAAQFDDSHEDIFVYSNVLRTAQSTSADDRFSASSLPITASFSVHLRADAGLIDNPLKTHFHRLRPYNFDKTLHPVCETNEGFSYPSGHSINGYLYAFALAEMLPEQRDRILARAQEYAHHRVVCGVHYPSDVEASRQVASFVFGFLLGQASFQRDLAAARLEVRAKLGYNP